MGILEVAKTGSNYAYWEVFRYGQDKDIFEIVDSPVQRFKGKRVQLKASEIAGLVMKEIGTYHNNDSSTLITPYGGITGAIFKRVEEYTEITLAEALNELANDRQVQIKKDNRFLTIYLYADFVDCGLQDFDDLLKAEYYIKK